MSDLTEHVDVAANARGGTTTPTGAGVSRRTFLGRAGFVVFAGSVAASVPDAASGSSASEACPPRPEYRESGHVRTYYRLARY